MLRYNIVVSINKNNVIGVNNQLLIECRDDLRRFYEITTDNYPEGDYNICIMGYNTWMSIPEIVRPFKKEMNIIISSNHAIKETDNCKVFHTLSDAFEWCVLNQMGKIFVIGGSMLFDECLKTYKNNLDTIYLTEFSNDYDCNNSIKFSNKYFEDTELIYHEKSITSECTIYNSDIKSVKHNYKIYQSKKLYEFI